jgi:hypothetical protein
LQSSKFFVEDAPKRDDVRNRLFFCSEKQSFAQYEKVAFFCSCTKYSNRLRLIGSGPWDRGYHRNEIVIADSIVFKKPLDGHTKCGDGDVIKLC